jgi:hypothetical protein
MVRGAPRGQALVEFALVAPTLLLLLVVVLDFGRIIYYNAEMSTASGEAARQAVLQYNNRSNLAAASCGSCQVPGVMPQVQRAVGPGIGAATYSTSPSSTSPPPYGTYQPGPSGQPGSIALSSTASVGTLYVFVYEFDPATGATNWATCDPCNGLRQGGGKWVVVDLKMKAQSVVLAFANLSPNVVLDAQVVSREEW